MINESINKNNIKNYLIYFEKITKKFNKLIANNNISFGVKKGTVHAILGENGAGKSTIMHILSGIIKKDSGQIFINNEVADLANPKSSRKYKIGIMQQHLPKLPSFKVYEYILLDDRMQKNFFKLKYFKMILKKSMDLFDIPIEIDKQLWELSVAERQLLEIFKIIYLGSSIIILDEPTSLLSELQGDKLLEWMKKLSRKGHTVIIVTHKLREVQLFSDFVTVLKKGNVVKTMETSKVSNSELASLMVDNITNETKFENMEEKSFAINENLLIVENISLKGPRGDLLLREISFTMRRNHIVGVAGITGNGQSELARIIAGIEKKFSGMLKSNSDSQIEFNKVRFIPSDRLGVGAAGDLSIIDNLILRDFNTEPVSRFGILNQKKIKEIGKTKIEKFHIKTSNLLSKTSSLSGGNIQRLVLARELEGNFNILIAHEPTSGLDINAVKFVRKNLVRIKDAGTSVLLISSDLDELMEIADTIIVLFDRTIVGIFNKNDILRENIVALMTGDSDMFMERVH